MKTIVVSIDRGVVLGEVCRKSAYIGAKRSVESDVYDLSRVVKEDSAELASYYHNALTALCSMLSPWYMELTGRDDILLRVPLNFDMSCVLSMHEVANDYCVNYILSEWLTLVGLSDVAEHYSSSATSEVELIVRMLNRRVRGRSPLYDEEHNVISRRRVVEQ